VKQSRSSAASTISDGRACISFRKSSLYLRTQFFHADSGCFTPLAHARDRVGEVRRAIGTMPFKVLDMLSNHPLNDIDLAQFLKDYSKVAQETAVLSR
jgi:hypothetical protein